MALQTWPEYVRDTIGEGTPAAAARRIEASRSTIVRWLDGSTPDPRDVIRFARAYERNPVHALTIAKYLRPGEGITVNTDIRLFPDEEFLEETKRRFNR